MHRGGQIVWVAVAFCIALQGCYTYKTLTVKIVDAESGVPVPGATVSVGYHENSDITYTPLFFLAPQGERTAVSGPDGIASASVNNYYPVWSITAPDYIGYGQTVEEGRVPSEFTRVKVGRRHAYVVPLYRDPKPVVWVVVPDGYRGPIRMSRTPVEPAAGTVPGQRVFEVHASPEGDVHVLTPPLLSPGRFSLYDDALRFRFANGEEIPSAYMRLKARARRAARQGGAAGERATSLPHVAWDYIYGVEDGRHLFVVGDAETWLQVAEPFETNGGSYHFEPTRFEIAWDRR